MPPLSKGVITLLVKCSPNTLVNSYQVYTSVGWISVFKNRWIWLWKKLNKDLVLCKCFNYFLISEQVIIFCKRNLWPVLINLIIFGYHWEVFTNQLWLFFGVKITKWVNPFFLESKEQAAITNAALPGTLNPKLASPLSTYWWIWIFYLDT